MPKRTYPSAISNTYTLFRFSQKKTYALELSKLHIQDGRMLSPQLLEAFFRCAVPFTGTGGSQSCDLNKTNKKSLCGETIPYNFTQNIELRKSISPHIHYVQVDAYMCRSPGCTRAQKQETGLQLRKINKSLIGEQKLHCMLLKQVIRS